MLNWLKSHPKLLSALGAALVSAASAFGLAPEGTQKVLRFVAALLGLV